MVVLMLILVLFFMIVVWLVLGFSGVWYSYSFWKLSLLYLVNVVLGVIWSLVMVFWFFV